MKRWYQFRFAKIWGIYAKSVGLSLSEPDKGRTALGSLICQRPLLQDGGDQRRLPRQAVDDDVFM